MGAQNSLWASQSASSRWLDPRIPSRRRRDFDGGLGPRRLRRVACLWSGRRAGLCWALRRFRLRGHLRLAPRCLLPLLGTHGDRALPRGAVLVVYNNVGDGLPAPRRLGPLGGLRPPSGPRPLWDLDPPAGRGITSSFSATSLSSQCALSPPPSISETDVSGESGEGTPAFSASRWFLAEISRCYVFLAAFAFLSSLIFFCSSFWARFLARISLSSRTGGRESLTIPILCKQAAIKKKAGRKRKRAQKSTPY